MKQKIFKGIALFTPGGDLFYCIDPTKQDRWHLHLCVALQETLELREPPHFLVPGYTATVDRWLKPHTREIKTSTEVYPAVKGYHGLLNAIFDLEPEIPWDIAPWQDEFCNPIALESYRDQFPQLWENHELVVQLEPFVAPKQLSPEQPIKPQPSTQQSYILRLFISHNSLSNPDILKNIHLVLEEGLNLPYTLKVVDINKHPELAENYQVSATPTLVRVWPQPVRRIVGEFENWQRVLQILTT